MADRETPGRNTSIYLVSVETGEKRRLTTLLSSADAYDNHPAFSPDGHTLAFTRTNLANVGNIYLQALNKDLTPRGEATSVTAGTENAGRTSWTLDGRELIFSVGSTDQNRALWRIPTSAPARRRRLDFAGEGVSSPAVSPTGQRLVYQRYTSDSDIWAVETTGPTAGQLKKLISSTFITEITLVQNWFEELKSLVPTGKN